MPTYGATARSAAITDVATSMVRAAAGWALSTSVIPRAGVALAIVLTLLPEKTRGFHQKHDHHDDEDHGVRSFGVEDLGQTLDDAEPESRDDRTEYRAHSADHDDGEDDDDHVGAHLRIDLIDRRGHDTGKRRERHAESVGQRDHPRDV